MRNLRLFLWFLMCCYVLHGQENNPKVSLSFEYQSRQQVLHELMALTNLEFFYLTDWLGNDLVSGEFKNIPVKELLDKLFEDTMINYFIFEKNKIILTVNHKIYDKLPEGFLADSSPKISNNKEKLDVSAPVFFNVPKTEDQSSIPTYRVGKEDGTGSEKNYRLFGYATLSGSNEPIEGLSILDKNTKQGAVTDSNGFYDIELRGGLNIIETRALGVTNKEVRIIMFGSGSLNLEFDESLERLDEVVVTADLYNNVEETLTGGEDLDAEKTKTVPLVLGERDVLKVATALPGIATAGEGAAGFNVRGGNADQNLVLFDNAVLYSPQHFFGIFSALNPFAISEFRIYKGSIPVEHGGRLSSVFDIKSKDGNSKEFTGEASIGPVTGNILLEVPIVKEKSSMILGGRGAYANWILRSIDEESLDNSQASFYDGMLSYSHQINDNNRIKATGYLSRDDFSITSDSLYVYKNKLASLNWNALFDDKNTLALSLATSTYDFEINYDRDSNDDFKLGYSINESDVKLHFSYLRNRKIRFDYGIEGKLYTIAPGSIAPLRESSIVRPLSIDTERGFESAAFASTQFDFDKKISVNMGLRYSIFTFLGEATQRVYADNMPRSESSVVDTLTFGNNKTVQTYGGPELRISARYLLNKETSLKAGYGNTIQYIHRLTNNTTVSPIDTWKLSDKNIAPQRGQQFSLGVFRNLRANTYEVSFEGFYKTSQSIIDFKTGAQVLLNENIETQVLQGNGKSYGLELLISKNSGDLNGWLGYTYSRSLVQFDSPFSEERINEGAFFPSNFDRPHDLSLVTNYKFTRRYSLSTNFVYQTGRPVTVPVANFGFNTSQFPVFSDRNSFRIPDFYRLDLGFNIEGNHKVKKFAHSFWTISIYNVLGRNNPFSVFFVTDNGEVKAVQSSIFTIPVPAITYNFKF